MSDISQAGEADLRCRFARNKQLNLGRRSEQDLNKWCEEEQMNLTKAAGPGWAIPEHLEHRRAAEPNYRTTEKTRATRAKKTADPDWNS